jgi:predicted ATPase/DNA-binding winged helix-turn-helix (wHTH) protein
MIGLAPQKTGILLFGPFTLDVGKRLLAKDGVPIELGARTLDTLTALISSPNEAISKRDLMAKIWPDVTVSEGSLRFHIASLRKALGDGIGGARYIVTLGGRGYSFVAPVTQKGEVVAALDNKERSSGVPSRVARMVGRADGVLKLSSELAAARFVTIVGTGGVGKTTIAVAVGHEMMEAFGGAVLFVDLGALRNSNLVAESVASMLGLAFQADDPTPGLIAYLRDKRILLILDNCEHLLDGAATLTERIFASAPQVHILATSREALRVEGEHIYRLEPLPFPPEDLELTAEIALAFPSVQLFVERAAASGARLKITDEDASIVAGICRKLGGLALAIELAAGRIGTYGLYQTATLLEEQLSLLWLGQRTAPQRQQTLKATLDWSYRLLSDLERRVLRQLAIFVGSFTLEAARTVLAVEVHDQIDVLGAIDSLIAKSMVTPPGLETAPRYRLLDTTRAYALEMSDDLEFASVAVRHAINCKQWLERNGADWPTLPNAAERANYLVDLANVRAALEWCFGPHGNAKIGVQLAAAAAPVFWSKALHSEARHWAERGILGLDASTRGSIEEIHLQATLAMSQRFAQGNVRAAQEALNRGLTIAVERNDASSLLQMLVPVHSFGTHTRDFTNTLKYTERCVAAAKDIGDPAAIAFTHSFLGILLHFKGELAKARSFLELGQQRVPGFRLGSAIYLGARHQVSGSVAMARTLWFQGHTTQAVERARRTVQYCASMDISHGVVFDWAFSVSIWAGDFQGAEDYLRMIVARAEAKSLSRTEITGFKGQLAIHQGNVESGVEALRAAVEVLRVKGFEMLTEFKISLVQGLATLGRHNEGMAIVEEAISAVQASGDLCYLPELLRLKGQLLLSTRQINGGSAENCFSQSLDLSRHQGALAWELRAATDFAALLIAHKRPGDARAILEPVCERFVKGADTPDLRAAERVLATLG